MKCGAKCFFVELEKNGEKLVVPITARTPVAARKTVRLEFGQAANIISVRTDKRK
ncbi:hypothetical protein P4654_18310 [Niallia taxi]|uniref:hypothetical protein n=1 Tax=Niallia taxi TaxID=2499688 RepID=UPI002E239B70|nr:hypothetical protein [Niallia taxi]MED4120894.1 hypothetical protein [Niallia taxi]